MRDIRGHAPGLPPADASPVERVDAARIRRKIIR